jgi:hypothetical protein
MVLNKIPMPVTDQFQNDIAEFVREQLTNNQGKLDDIVDSISGKNANPDMRSIIETIARIEEIKLIQNQKN